MKAIRMFQGFLMYLIAAGIAYQTLAIVAVGAFKKRRAPEPPPEEWPSVSILKPISGRDEELRENLVSFCTQDYPCYEVLMGFTDRCDSALPVAEDIARSFPDIARVVVKEDTPGTNRKVANLVGLERHSRFDLLALSDSDMRVQPDYLKTIAGEYLKRSGTGLVTCPYMVLNPVSMGAACESLAIAADLFPAILAARRIEGMSFGLGASLLFSKPVLQQIGGLSGVADYLADDYQIGNRIKKKGYDVVLSQYVMDDRIGPMGLADHIKHQLRWAVTYRTSRPKGHLASGITHLFPLALILALLKGGGAIALPPGALLLRTVLVLLSISRFAGPGSSRRLLALIPFKDLMAFGIWLVSLFIKRVSWRGRTYRILKDGKMKEVKSKSRTPLR